MPIPIEYQRASDEFGRFLDLVKNQAGFTSRNPAYTMTEGVFRTFRARLDVGQALGFANVLPAVLRALFIADWDIHQPVRPFTDRASMTREVQSLRRDHNFSPDGSIADVAEALWQVVDREAFIIFLSVLPRPAAAFWAEDDSEGQKPRGHP